MKKILFIIILILSSFLFSCNKEADNLLNSNEKSEYNNNNLSEYREEIESLYIELKTKYENIKENNEMNEWVEFKELFNYKLLSIKEKVSDTKLRYSVENLENLYNEYDKQINHNNI